MVNCQKNAHTDQVQDEGVW